ncbi:MAG: hypothetical protein H2058_09785 [Muricauda sp.]|nr:hypothetical protein [Allomuricauda sp.]MBA4745540.1 hypothetical protein [Allomuricauda sp.]
MKARGSASEGIGINAGEDITVGAGKSTTVTAGENLNLLARNISEQASESFTTETDSMENHAGEITRNSTNGNIDFQSKEDVKNNTSSKVNLF